MSPLDLTLEKVGMGRYQWKLLVLCGFGWLCDNMWLQSVAVILPRVQVHFRISDRWIGLLSTSIFFGMMIGAWIWGSYSDTYGRRGPFNGTLLMTAIFGLFCGFAPSFGWLCFSLVGLGIGVGGSMPTDGTLFLENIPKTRHYLLTGLSVFFSFGAVISSFLGLLILPGSSCKEPPPGQTLLCNSQVDNLGWRYLLITLGVLTFIMFGCRVALLSIEESPKYLISTGRAADAVLALEVISAQNGTRLTITEADVEDHSPGESSHIDHQYSSLRDSPPSNDQSRPDPRPKTSLLHGSEGWEAPITRAIGNLKYRTGLLMTPELKVTTLLVWAIWTVVSFAYTSFNVFLPVYLEKRHPEKSDIEDTLKEYLLYTIAGCPASLLASWMIETRLGRKKSMVLSAIGTSLGILAFLKIQSDLGIKISSMFISIMSTILYAVIYGYTPEVFPSSIRGTGYGIASALSRLSGMIGPLIVGLLMKIWNLQAALWMSVFVFVFAALLMCKLPIETRDSKPALISVESVDDLESI
ncbi:hypothetical protein PSTG_06192 [Puccinia striiformis f. sp. tritici PST-78]|uniref:Major facilitator superfamily (MFS) profile domain-containing protein n=1 Tax=Puccinia striiformis f. sp. tritici PST-78 TaxID=1165861 RepID=A0A0L0VMM6_9BASI|nr:hypothetical protein PSTG_06192 [Puccinia striiformis f. sp. tritici PST-78]